METGLNGLPNLIPSSLKINGVNYEDSDVDEDAIEDKKRSEEIVSKYINYNLKEQVIEPN